MSDEKVTPETPEITPLDEGESNIGELDEKDEVVVPIETTPMNYEDELLSGEPEWPSFLVFSEDEGGLLQPGDKGYPYAKVIKKLIEEAREADEASEQARALVHRLRMKRAENSPRVSNSQAVNATQALNRRLRLARDEKARKIQDALKGLGILDK